MKISTDIKHLPVQGVNLKADVFEQLVNDEPTLLVFLRHLGCPFCREMVQDLRSATLSYPDYPPVLFVFQGSPEQGSEFFERFWPTASAIADSKRTLYRSFGIEKAGIGELFNPAVIACGIRATMKGNMMGKVIGDPWEMPGLFLVYQDEILWKHDFEHAADHPDFERLPEKLSKFSDPIRS